MIKAVLLTCFITILLAAAACNNLQQHVTPNPAPQSTMPTLAPISHAGTTDATVTASVKATVQASAATKAAVEAANNTRATVQAQVRTEKTHTPTPTKKPGAIVQTLLPPHRFAPRQHPNGKP